MHLNNFVHNFIHNFMNFSLLNLIINKPIDYMRKGKSLFPHLMNEKCLLKLSDFYEFKKYENKYFQVG